MEVAKKCCSGVCTSAAVVFTRSYLERAAPTPEQMPPLFGQVLAEGNLGLLLTERKSTGDHSCLFIGLPFGSGAYVDLAGK